MTSRIESWLEAQTGATRRQMALRLGQAPSTFNRNIGTAELIVATCRAYGINPVDGLVVAEMITKDEVAQAASIEGLKYIHEKQLLEEVIRRVADGPTKHLQRPITEADIDHALDGNPDYTNMSESQASDFGLAANKGDRHIGFDDLPHEP